MSLCRNTIAMQARQRITNMTARAVELATALTFALTLALALMPTLTAMVLQVALARKGTFPVAIGPEDTSLLRISDDDMKCYISLALQCRRLATVQDATGNALPPPSAESGEAGHALPDGVRVRATTRDGPAAVAHRLPRRQLVNIFSQGGSQ